MQSNVLILTYWSYDDSLVQAYTLPYVRLIKKILPSNTRIILLTLEQGDRKSIDEQMPRIESSLRSEGIEWMCGRYRRFGFQALIGWIRMTVRLFFAIRSNQVKCIHCWGTPAGAIGLVLSRLTGTKLVIDSYEPHAEAMVENGTWRRSSFAFRVLFLFEKLQTRGADHLVAANAGMKKYVLEKFATDLKHIHVKPACVDLDLFSQQGMKPVERLQELGLTDKIVCVYAGKFGGIYLEKEVFDFFLEAHHFWGDRFRVLLLSGHSLEEINKYCALSGLDPSIIRLRFVPHREVPEYLGLADFALTPVKPVPTKRYCTPIKDGEYWATGLPVVITANISEDSEIIEANQIGAVLERLDSVSYVTAVKRIDELLSMPRDATALKIRAVARKHRSFEIAERIYRQIYGTEVA